MSYTVVIPDWHPTPLNALMRMHWAKRNRTVKTEYDYVWGYCFRAGIPKAKGKRRITQRLTLKGRDRRRDDDGAWKGLLDGLVKAEMLVDDGPDWVETTPLEFERGTQRKTTIIIEEVEDAP